MSDSLATTPLYSQCEEMVSKTQAEIICRDIVEGRHLVIAKAVVEMSKEIKKECASTSINRESDFAEYLDAAVRLLIGN